MGTKTLRSWNISVVITEIRNFNIPQLSDLPKVTTKQEARALGLEQENGFKAQVLTKAQHVLICNIPARRASAALTECRVYLH